VTLAELFSPLPKDHQLMINTTVFRNYAPGAVVVQYQGIDDWFGWRWPFQPLWKAICYRPLNLKVVKADRRKYLRYAAESDLEQGALVRRFGAWRRHWRPLTSVEALAVLAFNDERAEMPYTMPPALQKTGYSPQR